MSTFSNLMGGARGDGIEVMRVFASLNPEYNEDAQSQTFIISYIPSTRELALQPMSEGRRTYIALSDFRDRVRNPRAVGRAVGRMLIQRRGSGTHWGNSTGVYLPNGWYIGIDDASSVLYGIHEARSLAGPSISFWALFDGTRWSHPRSYDPALDAGESVEVRVTLYAEQGHPNFYITPYTPKKGPDGSREVRETTRTWEFKSVAELKLRMKREEGQTGVTVAGSSMGTITIPDSVLQSSGLEVWLDEQLEKGNLL